MNEIILNINNESDLYEKYSNNLSRELINYLIRKSKYSKGNIKIVVDTKLDIKNIDKILKDGLNEYFNYIKKVDESHNIKQLLLLFIGILFLVFSTVFNDQVIKEIIIITGWFSIWEVVNISLNIDSELNKEWVMMHGIRDLLL